MPLSSQLQQHWQTVAGRLPADFPVSTLSDRAQSVMAFSDFVEQSLIAQPQWLAHIADWSLEPHWHKPFLALSTGTQRKVFMAAALACGAPLLLTDCSFGPRDVIEPGVSGELVPVDDEAALAAGIARLIADPQRRAAMREAGFARVKGFAIEAMVENYSSLFEELVPGATRDRLPARLPEPVPAL